MTARHYNWRPACAPTCISSSRFSTFFSPASLAHRGAQGFASDAWLPLVEQAMLVFLLLVGFTPPWASGSIARSTPSASKACRAAPAGCAKSVWAWQQVGAIALVCVLPMLIAGGIAISYSRRPQHWGWLVADTAFFAAGRAGRRDRLPRLCFPMLHSRGRAGLAPRSVSPQFTPSCRRLIPGSSNASFVISLAFSLLLSTAYLRTRALWVSWGINFGWKASQALIFGLAVERRQQPFADRAGRSHGTFLAHRRSIRSRRQLARVLCSPCRPARRLPHHARS